MGSGYRTSYPVPPHWNEVKNTGGRPRALLMQRLYSKIFPPTPEDLPIEDEPAAEAEAPTAKPSTEDASVVSKDTADERQAKKLKTSTEDLGSDDWETVEKPNETISDQAADTSEEGGKVEALKLDGSDGGGVEKPVVEPGKGTGASVGHGQPENTLAKDW